MSEWWFASKLPASNCGRLSSLTPSRRRSYFHGGKLCNIWPIVFPGLFPATAPSPTIVTTRCPPWRAARSGIGRYG